MQETRRAILQFLKENGAATVDELAEALGGLTTVTVRHHLDILRSDGLVADPVIRHRSTPGRPQYAYSLTEKASTHFPKNYCALAAKVLDEVRASQSPETLDAFFMSVANRLACQAPPLVPGEPLAERLDRAVVFLDEQGYGAGWDQTPEGCLLHTNNCPYEGLAGNNPELCGMDLALVTSLLGHEPQRVSRVIEGAMTCAYLIPTSAAHAEAATANKVEPLLNN